MGQSERDLENELNRSDWTPAQGLSRAAFWGLIAASGLGLVSGAWAWFGAAMAINFWLRMALGFFLTWILFSVVHRAAGMAGWACTTLVIMFVALVILLQHVVFAEHGILTSNTTISGWICLHPLFIAATNVSTLIGIVFCTWLRHDGSAGIRDLADLMKIQVH